jgi:hypothetical protein
VIADPDLHPEASKSGRCRFCDTALSFDGEWLVWECPLGHDNYAGAEDAHSDAEPEASNPAANGSPEDGTDHRGRMSNDPS